MIPWGGAPLPYPEDTAWGGYGRGVDTAGGGFGMGRREVTPGEPRAPFVPEGGPFVPGGAPFVPEGAPFGAAHLEHHVSQYAVDAGWPHHHQHPMPPQPYQQAYSQQAAAYSQQQHFYGAPAMGAPSQAEMQMRRQPYYDMPPVEMAAVQPDRVHNTRRGGGTAVTVAPNAHALLFGAE